LTVKNGFAIKKRKSGGDDAQAFALFPKDSLTSSNETQKVNRALLIEVPSLGKFFQEKIPKMSRRQVKHP